MTMVGCRIRTPAPPNTCRPVGLAHVKLTGMGISDEVNALDARQGRAPGINVLLHHHIKLAFGQVDLFEPWKLTDAEAFGQQFSYCQVACQGFTVRVGVAFGVVAAQIQPPHPLFGRRHTLQGIDVVGLGADSFDTLHRPKQTSKQPAGWTASLNKRNNVGQLKVAVALSALPLVEASLYEHVEWMILAVVPGQVDLCFFRRKCRLPQLQQIKQIQYCAPQTFRIASVFLASWECIDEKFLRS